MKIALLALLLLSSTSFARGVQNLDSLIEALHTGPYYQTNHRVEKKLKIAILDNGFGGYEDEVGKSLPAYTQFHAGPVQNDNKEVHGLRMAQIYWEILTNAGTISKFEPEEFHLYNTNGYSNFAAAVNDVIAQKIDVVLYSQTWEYGGNFDGRGFINTLVSKATDAGVLWINNAGNFAQTTFNSPIKNGSDNWVKLPGQNSSVEIRCEENLNKKCNLRTVLSWNSFSDDVEAGTNKDLDFVLTDDTLNIIQSSNLTQQENPPTDATGYSKYPREIITAELKPGLYFLRVKNRSNNFDAKDKLRITASGDFVTMKNFDAEENVLTPADNTRVITVGASDSEKSSVSLKRGKPDLWAPSLITLSKEENYKGSSNSAAMVAAGISIYLSLYPNYDKDELISNLSRPMNNNPRGNGLPITALGFLPTGPNNCFVPVPQNYVPPYAYGAIQAGGTMVETTIGWRIMFNFDPIRLMPGVQRIQFNDILVIGPTGTGIFNRQMIYNLPRELIEVLQLPQGYKICGTNENAARPGREFRLP